MYNVHLSYINISAKCVFLNLKVCTNTVVVAQGSGDQMGSFKSFFKNSFCFQVPVLRPGVFTLLYNIWQDAGNRTRVAATARKKGQKLIFETFDAKLVYHQGDQISKQ